MSEIAPDDLRQVADNLRKPNPLYQGYARVVVEESIFVAVCLRPDHIGQDTNGTCIDCELIEVHNEAFAAQIAGLLNAREPIAAWLESVNRRWWIVGGRPEAGRARSVAAAVLGKAPGR